MCVFGTCTMAAAANSASLNSMLEKLAVGPWLELGDTVRQPYMQSALAVGCKGGCRVAAGGDGGGVAGMLLMLGADAK